MFSRRAFAGMIAAGLTEAAFAQRAKLSGVAPADTVWINGNEFPEGPPQASIEAMAKVIGSSNRYHYQEFPAFYEKLAAHEGLTADQILVGAGSSEPLHAAVEAFTSPTLPLIIPMPTYEAAPELTRYKGFPVIETPLNAKMQPDVRRLAAEAQKAGGGLIYIVNPNNPTSSITSSDDLSWLVANLPKNTNVLVDEAYIHYATSPEISSSFRYVKEGKNVIVARTFSKIYGMAGLRVGYVAAPPEMIKQHGAVPQQRDQHRERACGSGRAGTWAEDAGGAQGQDRSYARRAVLVDEPQEYQIHSAAGQLRHD